MTESSAKGRREVIVVGAARPGLRSATSLPGRAATSRSSRRPREPAAAWRERWDSLKLFTPARYDALPGLAVPRRPGPLPRPRRGRRLPDRLRPPLRSARRARQPRPLDPQDRRRLPGRARRPDATRPIRSSSPPARSRCRSCRRSPSASARRSCSSTARAYRSPEAHPRRAGARGRRRQHRLPDRRGALRARTRCTCRSDRARRRCRSASWAATCSGTSTRPG